ncbi:MAG: DMT family transporter [Candidatus Aminicenantes bacterium]|nr:DMT family transporter [Candidatus Aminicenantes bacterium]
MEKYKKFGLSDVLMLLAILLWSINFSFVKVALREFTPLGFNGIRLLFASLLLVFFLFVSRENFRILKTDIWKFVALGIVGNTAYQMLFIHGINLTTASNTSIIIATTPIFIALLSLFLKHEKLNWASWAGILISFVGFYFVLSKQPGSLSLNGKGAQGDLMILLGTLCWAVYTVFSLPLLKRISPLKLTLFTMVSGTAFFLPFCVKDMIQIPYSQISFKAWASLAFSGLFALSVCYVIWYASVKRVGNSRTAIYDNLVPIFTIFFAYFLLDERMSLLQGVGTLVILGGVYLTRSGYRFFERRTNI